MATLFAELGKQAAQYYLSNPNLSSAAATALAQYRNAHPMSDPELHAHVQQVGQLAGFGSFYVAVEGTENFVFHRLGQFVTDGLDPHDTANILRCAELMIRIEAIRCLMRRQMTSERASTHLERRIGEVTLQEIGLRCVGRPEGAGFQLENFLRINDTNYNAICEEIAATCAETDGVYAHPTPMLNEMRRVLAITSMEDRHAHIHVIAIYMIRYYAADQSDKWSDDSRFELPPAPLAARPGFWQQFRYWMRGGG